MELLGPILGLDHPASELRPGSCGEHRARGRTSGGAEQTAAAEHDLIERPVSRHSGYVLSLMAISYQLSAIGYESKVVSLESEGRWRAVKPAATPDTPTP